MLLLTTPFIFLFARLAATETSLHYNVLNGTNFPDPCIIKVGNVSHVFGTVDGYGHNIPTTHNRDFNNPNTWSAVTEAFPTTDVPAFGPHGWALANTSWAPDVQHLTDYDGSYAMYYAPALQTNDTIHCIGIARSRHVSGPYNDTTLAPLICPAAAGGAIDAAGFLDDAHNKRYVVYKIDGPAIKDGGYCASPSNPPSYNTSLMLQEVEHDASTPIGGPRVLYNNDGIQDKYNIEAPDIVRGRDGTYFLLFSSGCTNHNSYTLSYVTSTAGIWGPYGDRKVLLKTGDYGLYAPGSATVGPETLDMVFHSLLVSNNISDPRVMSTADVELEGRVVRIKK